jgi:hypothetical protein
MAKKSAKIIEIREMAGETGLVIIEQVNPHDPAGNVGDRRRGIVQFMRPVSDPAATELAKSRVPTKPIQSETKPREARPPYSPRTGSQDWCGWAELGRGASPASR